MSEEQKKPEPLLNTPFDFMIGQIRLYSQVGAASHLTPGNAKTLLDELDRLRKIEIERNAIALRVESLTPGGSEFHGDLDRCFLWIKDRLSTTPRRILAAEAERDTTREGMRNLLPLLEDVADLLRLEHADPALIETWEREVAALKALLDPPKDGTP